MTARTRRRRRRHHGFNYAEAVRVVRPELARQLVDDADHPTTLFDIEPASRRRLQGSLPAPQDTTPPEAAAGREDGAP